VRGWHVVVKRVDGGMAEALHPRYNRMMQHQTLERPPSQEGLS